MQGARKIRRNASGRLGYDPGVMFPAVVVYYLNYASLFYYRVIPITHASCNQEV